MRKINMKVHGAAGNTRWIYFLNPLLVVIMLRSSRAAERYD
jgi:hypothetical protein